MEAEFVRQTNKENIKMIASRNEDIDPRLILIPANHGIEEQAISSMAASIREEGLFHPPMITEGKQIVAGRKRVLGAIRAGVETINVKVVPDGLAPEEYESLSLHENLKRHNLPWYEQVVMEKKLHELRQKQHGEGKRGKKVGWSLRDTAQELDMALGVLSEDIRMAEAFLADPTLRKVEDKTTARRVIFEMTKRAAQEYSAGSDNVQKSDVNVVHLGSSEVILKQYPDNTFDACVTDPPWLEYKDQGLVKDEFTLDVFKEVYRVLKPNAFLYAFVSTQDWIIYERAFTEIGFRVQKWPLVWLKEGVLSHGRQSWEYQRDYEPILLAVKGSPALSASMLTSVMSCKVVPSVKMVHPNEKPPDIIRRLLDHCTYEGSLVLEPFGGSGVVADVCVQMRRDYVLIEKNRDFYMQILHRLGKEINKANV